MVFAILVLRRLKKLHTNNSPKPSIFWQADNQKGRRPANQQDHLGERADQQADWVNPAELPVERRPLEMSSERRYETQELHNQDSGAPHR